MARVVIIGAGGHAREVLEILLACRADGHEVEPLGFIDENPDKHGQTLDGFPVLGDFRWFDGKDRDDIEVICAVGTPHACRKLAQQAASLGLRFASAISLQACISRHAHIGRGVMIFPNVVVNTGAVIGDHAILNVAVTVVPGCRETVIEGQNGFLVPPRDVQAPVRALHVLIGRPELRQRMGRRSRELAVERFSSEKITAEYVGLYRKLLSKRRSP